MSNIVKAFEVKVNQMILYNPTKLVDGAGHHRPSNGYRATVLEVRSFARKIYFRLTVGWLQPLDPDQEIEIDTESHLTDAIYQNRSANPKKFRGKSIE